MKKFYFKRLFLFFALVGLVILFSGCSNDDGVKKNNLDDLNGAFKPVSEITHGHGLAVSSADPDKLYIATHDGLLVLMNEKDLYRIGNSNDDYMGFSAHPSLPNIFFTSGHSHTGKNLGFQKSEDGGKTWQKISNGVNGPVDFHAMTVSPANPDILYGWHFDSIQRTGDDGKNWEILKNNLDTAVIGLTAHPKDEKTLFATTLGGIMVSKNRGENFENFSEELKGAAVLFLAIDPKNPEKMFSMSQKFGFAVSHDSGKTWQKMKEDFDGDMPFYISISPVDSNIIYVMTKKNAVYRSRDGGNVWTWIYGRRRK